MNKKPYKYHNHLLCLYEHLPLHEYTKTRVLREVMDKNLSDTGNKWANRDQQLSYVSGKGFIYKHHYKRAGIEPKNQSDRLSNWWKITDKGLIEIANVFGHETIKDEDKPYLAKLLLSR